MFGSQLKTTGASLVDTGFENSQVIVPNSLKFTKSRAGLGARRIPIKIRAEQQSYGSSNNNLVRIILPNNNLYDTRNGYLTFDVTLNTTGGTYKRVHTGIFSLFNRFRMVAGSTEIEDIKDYNRIYSALWQMINPAEVTTAIGDQLMGFGTTAQRNALGATTTSYACPIFSGVLNTELLPFDNINSGMFIDFYLERAEACLETDGTAPSFTISNIILCIERLELEQSYRDFIKSYIRKNGLEIGFHTWERYISALTTGATQNLTINHKSSSMNGMLNFLVDSSTLNSPTTNDRFLTWPSDIGGSNLTETSLFINGSIFPDEPIDCLTARKVQPYQMYCRWIMKWKLNGFLQIAPPITNAAFITDKFVQIDDLEAYPEEFDLINPFSTLGNNATLIKKLRFSGVVLANWQLDSWVEYFRRISISTDGTVLVQQ